MTLQLREENAPGVSYIYTQMCERGSREDGVRPFSAVPSNMTRGYGYKLKCMKALIKSKKTLFTVHWQQVAHRCCSASILGDTQKPSGYGPVKGVGKRSHSIISIE